MSHITLTSVTISPLSQQTTPATTAIIAQCVLALALTHTPLHKPTPPTCRISTRFDWHPFYKLIVYTNNFEPLSDTVRRDFGATVLYWSIAQCIKVIFLSAFWQTCIWVMKTIIKSKIKIIYGNIKGPKRTTSKNNNN